MSSYTIEYRGESEDAYIVGDLAAAKADASDSEGCDLNIIVTTGGAGFWAVDEAEHYWGAAATEDDAVRFLIGAVLDPREGC